MAYTPLPSVATGDLWSASDHNTYIRANFAAGVPDIFTTAGDMVYGTAADVAARLGIGSTDAILRVVSGLPAWSSIMVPKVTAIGTDVTYTSQTTLQDTTMLFAVGANEVWAFLCLLRLAGGSAIGFKMGVNGPASPSAVAIVGLAEKGGAGAVLPAYASAYGQVDTSTAAGGSTGLAMFGRIANGANAGNVVMQGAQGGSSGTPTTLYAGALCLALRLS